MNQKEEIQVTCYCGDPCGSRCNLPGCPLCAAEARLEEANRRILNWWTLAARNGILIDTNGATASEYAPVSDMWEKEKSDE
jgi:hypothetical protein